MRLRAFYRCARHALAEVCATNSRSIAIATKSSINLMTFVFSSERCDNRIILASLHRSISVSISIIVKDGGDTKIVESTIWPLTTWLDIRTQFVCRPLIVRSLIVERMVNFLIISHLFGFDRVRCGRKQKKKVSNGAKDYSCNAHCPIWPLRPFLRHWFRLTHSTRVCSSGPCEPTHMQCTPCNHKNFY